MLKVVGASWLQTRISTYILLAVALLGIGAIILGEFGQIENDGTYSATVSWNRKGGYRIDFWGQGNDLSAVPLNAARAYYKTGIHETGWSVIEIETSPKYPDAVQAYAAGYLEGSLTWQLIHHHWYNTVGSECERKPDECNKLMRQLRENSAIIRERSNLLHTTEPFWHMVRLFYNQLDGLEAGWRFAVRRSRQSAEMSSEDFLWLAMASDLPSNLTLLKESDDEQMTNSQKGAQGIILLRALSRVDSAEPLIGIGQNTVAPYSKMLRLLKRYKFGYHLLPASVTPIPTRSVVMSSYPGALSSQDEFYLLNKNEQRLIVAGTPLSLQQNRVSHLGVNISNSPKYLVMPSSVRVMAANRLATDGRTWSRMMISVKNGRISGGSVITASPRQWVTYEPRKNNLWLTEHLPGSAHAADYTEEFFKKGFLACTGAAHFPQIKEAVRRKFRTLKNTVQNASEEENEDEVLKRLQTNLTTLEHVRKLMQGYSYEESIIAKAVVTIVENNSQINSNETRNSSEIITFSEDIAIGQSPVGVIDTKIVAAGVDGLETFEVTSGPLWNAGPFSWSETFPNISHIGHPNVFAFQPVTPVWVWN